MLPAFMRSRLVPYLLIVGGTRKARYRALCSTHVNSGPVGYFTVIGHRIQTCVPAASCGAIKAERGPRCPQTRPAVNDNPYYFADKTRRPTEFPSRVASRRSISRRSIKTCRRQPHPKRERERERETRLFRGSDCLRFVDLHIRDEYSRFASSSRARYA